MQALARIPVATQPHLLRDALARAMRNGTPMSRDFLSGLLSSSSAVGLLVHVCRENGIAINAWRVEASIHPLPDKPGKPRENRSPSYFNQVVAEVEGKVVSIDSAFPGMDRFASQEVLPYTWPSMDDFKAHLARMGLSHARATLMPPPTRKPAFIGTLDISLLEREMAGLAALVQAQALAHATSQAQPSLPRRRI